MDVAVPDRSAPDRLIASWPAAFLPGMALVALLVGGIAAESASETASDERPAGRTVVELEVSR